MCYFQNLKFEMYTEQPRIKDDYWQEGETEERYRKRMIARRRKAAERNITANAASRAAGKIITLRKRLKVAE